jgi:predicted protein tyrosine phosphatase
MPRDHGPMICGAGRGELEVSKHCEEKKRTSQPEAGLQIIALDRQSVERGIRCPEPYAVVSIRDPGTKEPRIRNTVGLREVIYLAFHDAEPTSDFELPAAIRLMSDRHATQIAAFVTKHKNHVSTIVCHCEQGMSRSPAVAAAIAHSWGIPIPTLLSETQPNKYVYKLVKEAMARVGKTSGQTHS